MNSSYDARINALLLGQKARSLSTDLGEVTLRYETHPKQGGSISYLCVSLRQKAQLSDISWKLHVSDLNDALKYVRAERVTHYYLSLDGVIDDRQTRAISYVSPISYHGAHLWQTRRKPEVTLDEILDSCERGLHN